MSDFKMLGDKQNIDLSETGTFEQAYAVAVADDDNSRLGHSYGSRS